jgi:hypothetical protein
MKSCGMNRTWPTLAPQYSAGASAPGVTTVTSTSELRRFFISCSKRFFMPLIWVNGLGSTKIATFCGALRPAWVAATAFKGTVALVTRHLRNEAGFPAR